MLRSPGIGVRDLIGNLCWLVGSLGGSHQEHITPAERIHDFNPGRSNTREMGQVQGTSKTTSEVRRESEPDSHFINGAGA